MLARKVNINDSDMEDLALELGSTVRRLDGSVFNSSGRAGVRRLPKPPVPEIAAAPPAPVSDNTALLKVLQDMVAKMQPQAVPEIRMPEINVPAPQVVVQAAKKCSWEFEFNRNPDGTIKSIKATPKE